MMIIMSTDASQKQVDQVIVKVKALGFDPHIVYGEERTVIGVVGNNPFIATQGQLFRMPGCRPDHAHLASLQTHFPRVHSRRYHLSIRRG